MRLTLLCRDVSNLVICGQGPPPPNPAVVERFQQVISQLFQQVLCTVFSSQSLLPTEPPSAVEMSRAA